jgi:hypothetical protein
MILTCPLSTLTLVAKMPILGHAYASLHGSPRFVQKVAWHSKVEVRAPVADIVRGRSMGRRIRNRKQPRPCRSEFLAERLLGDQATQVQACCQTVAILPFLRGRIDGVGAPTDCRALISVS